MQNQIGFPIRGLIAFTLLFFSFLSINLLSEESYTRVIIQGIDLNNAGLNFPFNTDLETLGFASGLTATLTTTSSPTLTFTPSPTTTFTATPPPSTSTPSITPTETPTSMPGIPILISPGNESVLPQPVSPNEWYFSWDARTGPCSSIIDINGPGGRQITDYVNYGGGYPPYEYHYTGEYLPDDALSPWFWQVTIWCPLGSNYSETRTFSVLPVPTSTPTALPTDTPLPPTKTSTPTETSSSPSNTPSTTPTYTPLPPTGTQTSLPPITSSPTPTPEPILFHIYLPLVIIPTSNHPP